MWLLEVRTESSSFRDRHEDLTDGAISPVPLLVIFKEETIVPPETGSASASKLL